MSRRRQRPARELARLSLLEFISDPALLGPFFEGPSWDTWRAVVKAATAAPMTERDPELFAKVSGGRKPPTKPVHELVVCAGRGAGKDAIASAIACHRAVTGDFSRLRPGERGTVMMLATDRDQAAIAHGFTTAYFERVPILAGMVEGEPKAETLELSNGASIVISTANVRAPRGRTICAAIFDEVAFWRSEESASPDVDVDAAVSPGLMRFPGSLKILISSVNKRSGLLYERFVEHFGKDSDDVLVVLGTSLDFNPTLDAKAIERAVEKDPERYGAEYLSRWRDDISSLFDRELVEAATDNVVVRQPQPDIAYAAFVDASGGRGDSFTVGIGHADGNCAVLDCILERKPPFNLDQVMDEIAALLRSYGIGRVTGDNYAAGWVADAFEKRGIRYIKSERKRSDLYLDLLPLLTSGRARLLRHPRLTYQLTSLERRASRSGKDSVDHPHGGQDDIANVAAGALVTALTECRPSLIAADAILADKPDAPLGFVVGAYATLWIAADGECAYAIFAHVLDGTPGGSAVIASFDQRPWTAAVPEAIASTLGAFVDEACRQNQRSQNRGVDAVMFVPGHFEPMCWAAMQQALGSRLSDIKSGFRSIACDPIASDLLSDPVDLVLQAGAAVSAGRVRLTAEAQRLTGRVPMFAALAARPGEQLFADPLRAALLLGIVLGIGGPVSDAPPDVPAARLVNF